LAKNVNWKLLKTKTVKGIPVLDYVLETSGMCSGSFPLISSPDEIFYFLIRKSKTMLIDSVDFGII